MANTSSSALNYDLVIYVEEQALATPGGSFNSGAWRTRVLNTERYSRQTTSWASLASNQITLQPGSYLIEASAPATGVANHAIRFQNVTDAVEEIVGTAEFPNSADIVATRSFLEGVITIDSAKTFELQHRCTTSRASFGFGPDSNIITNTYSMVMIKKLK